MKVSRKSISFIISSIVIGLLISTTIVKAIGVDTDPLPNVGLQWTISGVETIDSQDYYLTENIYVETGGELRILNSNFYIDANSLRIDVRQGGSLYVENSVITVTDPAYIYTLTSVSNVDLPLTGSDYTFIDSNVVNAKFSITQYLQKDCKFDSTNTTFEHFSQFRLQYVRNINLQESTFYNSTEGVEIVNGHSVIVQHNTFQLLDFGLDISSSDGGAIGYNDFLDITDTGLLIDDFSRTNVQGLPQVEIKWNTFDNMETGASLEDSRMHFMYNDMKNLDVALIMDNSDFGTYEYNNFTSIVEECMIVTETRLTDVRYNKYLDCNIGIYSETSSIVISHNDFDNLTIGVKGYDTDEIHVYYNNFNNISYYAINVDETREVEFVTNTISNSLGGILLTNARTALIQENILDTVEDGVAVVYARDVSILGNTVNNTISGYYIETSTEIIFTANGAINAQYGLSLWSVTEATLASNGVFDSVYGISIWFSERVELAGNEVSTSSIGIVGRNTAGITVRDGQYTVLNKGVQLLGCYGSRIYGNTFNNIVEDAITLSDSTNYVVYNNNFLTVGNYGDIENSFGRFYKQFDNETYVGNYYLGLPLEPVLIDVFTVNSVTYNVTDDYPLASRYNVQPSVEYLERDIQDPTDIEPVEITTQIFLPEDTENVEVFLQYNLVNETFWRIMDITATETQIGSIGAINQYKGTIQPLPYDYDVVYRIMVNYTVDLIGQSIFSINGTYHVLESEETPIVIGTPQVRVIVYSGENNNEVTMVTNAFYEDTEYYVFVSVRNRTDIQILAGKRHVNLTWYEIDTSTNETETFTGIMDYNSSLEPYAYSTAFGRSYTVGMVIKFFISVVDINGTVYRTVLNYTMVIEPPIEKSGFDTITLLTLGGTLLIIQIIVVYRRRKSKEE